MTLKHLMDMSERRVLITGASGSLGRVMSSTLAEMGSDLLLIDLPGTGLEKFAKDLRDSWRVKVKVAECDLESENERTSLISSVKADGLGLNCLINNAAFVGSSGLEGWVAPLNEQSLDTWRRAIEVNLTACFHLSQGFAPELKSSVGGNIINIGSIYGEYGPDWSLYEGTTMGNPAAYAASKGALIQLTRWLSTTLAPEVRVNSISPGGVLRGQPDQFVERYCLRTPLARMANSDDFSGAVAYLASDMSCYVTGQVLRVNGGWGEW